MNTEREPRFVSELITPVTVSHDVDAMVRGEPGLPRAFTWRGEELQVVKVLRTWRECGPGPCKQGSSESYVRKHWFEVEIGSRQTARIYFERQPRGRSRTKRWWLFSIAETQDSP